MKIAVYGNQCQDHKVEEIRALFEALRASGAFIEVERGFLEYVKGLIPDVAADKAVGDGEVSADVVVSIGGDGTFLRAAAWVVHSDPFDKTNVPHRPPRSEEKKHFLSKTLHRE